MADILRHHNISQEEKAKQPGVQFAQVQDIHGTGVTHPITSEDYEGLVDPLSSGAAVANKPASSIPSIFGRPIFFRTALASIKPQNLEWTDGTPPVYNQIASQWLDLMEMVFNQSLELKFERWNKDQQIRALKASGHLELAEALETHMTKFFPDTEDIYLISTESDGLIGATSPYTFVFTSTNWKSNKPVVSLRKRETRFREFMYRIYLAYNTGIADQVSNGSKMVPNRAKDGIKGMLKYLKNCLDTELDVNLKAKIKNEDGTYNFNNLSADYPNVKYSFNPGEPAKDILVTRLVTGTGVDAQVVPMYLPSRKSTNLQSDFFIDSDLVPFDQITTPLALVVGQYGNLLYYDDNLWNNNTIVPQTANDNELERKMPDCKGYRHVWLTEVDFLEEKLVELPYNIDNKKFDTLINVEDTKYLIPLKPKAFKYFSLDTIKKNLKVTVNPLANQVNVEFVIPIRNVAGDRKHELKIARAYDLKEGVEKTNPVLGSLSVGVAPFIKDSLGLVENKYSVMLQYSGDVPEPVAMEFYNQGKKVASEVGQRNDKPMSFFYNINGTIDVMRLVLGTGVGGAIIPMMAPVQQGSHKYWYAIDFGTTNTHIAYISDADTNSHSFTAEDIQMQAVYLAKKPDVKRLLTEGRYKEVIDAINTTYGTQGRQLIFDQAREFFPNFVGNDYDFPIRTALHEKSPIADKLYVSASIGFRFPKESFDADIKKYVTSLKWDLSSISAGPNADLRVLLFFEEILRMVRAHWLSRDDADKTISPMLVLTYPQAMSNSAKMMRQWNLAYQRVFGVNGQQKIVQIVESFAPAQKLITGGQANHVEGVLNVDIGGGTTDIQYYRVDGANTIARYNSVQFAGDDLWGVGYENLGANLDKKDNLFTRMAKSDLKDRTVKIGFEEIPVAKINLAGKEYINMLLRDSNKQFVDLITESASGNTIQRKALMLHYAAIIYHIANWIKADPKMAEKFPAVINFTGFGSKYIEAIFGENHNDHLVTYTRELLKNFGVDPAQLGAKFTVRFEANPKAVTAEGAALLAKDGKVNIPQRASRHFGFDNSEKQLQTITLGDTGALAPDVMDFFEKFIEGFQKTTHPDINVVPLTDLQLSSLKSAADTSYNQVRVYKSQPAQSSNTQVRVEEIRVDDSLFFWTLKGAICDIDL